jgi:hypothetical protein
MDLLEQLKELLDELAVGGNKITNNQTDRLFNIHNQIFINNKEHGRSCGTCRSRVYNKMKTYYNNATAS